MEWAFDQYATFTLVREGERYATAAVPFAEEEQLELVAAEGASKLIRLGDGSQFVERVVAPTMVELPVEKGEKLGEVVVMDGDEEVARVDLVAGEGHRRAELRGAGALVRRPRPRRGRRPARLRHPGPVNGPESISARIAPVPSPHPVG